MHNLRMIVIATVILLLLPGLYVGSYVALLQPILLQGDIVKGNYIIREAEYRYGGQFSQYFFAPIHWIDVELRPRFWFDLTEQGRRWEGKSH
jgi:hypothetical protein